MKCTVVCGNDMAKEMAPALGDRADRRGDRTFSIMSATLSDPGNSSLKGINRTLVSLRGVPLFGTLEGEPDWTVVLLGDVVYSWECLRVICAGVAIGRVAHDLRAHGVRVVTTRDLGPSSGELWGISYPRDANGVMEEALGAALAKHPPFHDTYQPGQMRQWLYALPTGLQEACLRWVDDYTRDIDTPEHLALLPELSKTAALDDLENGLPW